MQFIVGRRALLRLNGVQQADAAARRSVNLLPRFHASNLAPERAICQREAKRQQCGKPERIDRVICSH
jgi:hypothetical protein